MFISYGVRLQILKHFKLEQIISFEIPWLDNCYTFWRHHYNKLCCKENDYTNTKRCREIVLTAFFTKMQWQNLRFYTFDFKSLTKDITVMKLNNKMLLTGTNKGAIEIFSLRKPKQHYKQLSHGGIWCIDKYKNCLITGSVDTHVTYYNYKKKWITDKFKAHNNTVRCMKIYEQLLITAGRDGVIKIFNKSTRELLKQYEYHEDAVRCIEIKDGYLISGDYSGFVHITDIYSKTTGSLVCLNASSCMLYDRSLMAYYTRDTEITRVYAVDIGVLNFVCSTLEGYVVLIEKRFESNTEGFYGVIPKNVQLSNHCIAWCKFSFEYSFGHRKVIEKYIVCACVKGELFVLDLTLKIVKSFHCKNRVKNLIVRNKIVLLITTRTVELYCLENLIKIGNLVTNENIEDAVFEGDNIVVGVKRHDGNYYIVFGVDEKEERVIKRIHENLKKSTNDYS